MPVRRENQGKQVLKQKGHRVDAHSKFRV